MDYFQKNIEILGLNKNPVFLNSLWQNYDPNYVCKTASVPIEETKSYCVICIGLSEEILLYLRKNSNIRMVYVLEWDIRLTASLMHTVPFYELADTSKFKTMFRFQFINNSDNPMEMISSIEAAAQGELRSYVNTAIILDFKGGEEGRHIEYSFRNALMVFGGGFEDSYIGFKNMIDNMDYICQSAGILDYKDKFKGERALIVGSGPDIDETRLEEMRQLQSKMHILAADSILEKLVNNGIRVDFVFSLERVPHQGKFWKNINPNLLMRTFLVFVPVMYKHCVDDYPGYAIVCARPFSHFQFLEMPHLTDINPEVQGALKYPGIDTGPSCLNMALVCGYYMGFREFVFMGANLSTPNPEQSHSEGIDEVALIPKDRLREVDVNGQKLYVTEEWIWFRSHLEKFMWSHGDAIYNNATRNGIPLNYAKPISDLSVYLKYQDIKPIVPPELTVATTNERRRIWHYKFGTAYLYLKNLIPALIRDIEQLNYIRNGLLRNATSQAEFSYALALKENMKAYVISNENFYFIIAHMAQSYLLNYDNILYSMNLESLEGQIGTIDLDIKYFETIKYTAQRLYECLRE